MPIHIDPNHYLQPASDNVSPIENINQAWARAYAELEQALQKAGAAGQLCIVCGLSRAGKTTWVREHLNQYPENTVFFDAALPARQQRAKALQMARAHGVPAVAVWMDISVPLALQRNKELPKDEQSAESTVRHTFAFAEPPTTAEGFAQVTVVQAQDGPAA